MLKLIKENYLTFLLLLVPYAAMAQYKVSGLGNYVIGQTTPDTIQHAGFRENDQLLAKGTLTLPCTHIRMFTSAKEEIGGVSVSNISLLFYDDKLFRITCDYPNELATAFITRHGKGALRPATRLSFCGQGDEKTMLMQAEVWRNGDVLALAFHAKGYNANCQPEQIAQLIMTSQSMSELSSDCDLQPGDLFADELDEVMN